MKTPKMFVVATATICLTLMGLTSPSPVTAADSVWVQSYQRASQSATCDSPPESVSEWRASWANPYDPISGPTWHPTWERWANNGSGGWTCTRSITWARTPVSSGSTARSYAIGDTGPGGGLVFLISGGLTYEMAPKNWNNPTSESALDPNLTWCAATTNVPLAVGIAVGTGASNTAAMADPTEGCASSPAATAALAYPGTNGSAGQWFIPSVDELNAMCNYSRNPSDPAAPSVPCDGGSTTAQNATFASGPYGFASGSYWSSSQTNLLPNAASTQDLGDGGQGASTMTNLAPRVRPVRAF